MAAYMRTSTGQIPFPRPIYQTGADRVQLDVEQSGDEAIFIDGTGEEPILPEMTGLAPADLKPAGIVLVCAADRLCQRILALRYACKVDMISHEAIASKMYRIETSVFSEQVLIDLPIVVLQKHCLAMIPTLGNVVYQARNHDTG